MKFKQITSVFKEQRIWGCRYKGYQFVIVLEEKMGEEFKDWTGYSVSYIKENDKENIKINGIVDSFNEAVKLCKQKLKELTTH